MGVPREYEVIDRVRVGSKGTDRVWLGSKGAYHQALANL